MATAAWRPEVTGGEVGVAGALGPRTRGAVSVGTEHGDDGQTVTGEASVRHRIGERVTVGGSASVTGNTRDGTVSAEGGASVAYRDRERLAVAGNASVSGSTADGAVRTEAGGRVTGRIGDRVTVGGNVSGGVNGDGSEIRAAGGATVRVMTSDRTVLAAQGLIDSHGTLTHRLELNVFRDRVRRLPLTDEGRTRVLQLFLQASHGTGGGDGAAPRRPSRVACR